MRSPSSSMGEPGSKDEAGPASLAQLFCQMEWEGSSGGRDRFPEAGASRAAVGAVGPAAMRRKGAEPIQVRRQRELPAPTLVGESMGRLLGWLYCPLGIKGSPSPGSGWGPGSLRQRCILWELGLSLVPGVKTSSVPGDEGSLLRIIMTPSSSSSSSSRGTLVGSRCSPRTLPFNSSFTRSTDSGDCGEAGSMVITGKSALGS